MLKGMATSSSPLRLLKYAAICRKDKCIEGVTVTLSQTTDGLKFLAQR